MKKIIILMLLASCNLTPEFHAPTIAVPPAWKNAPANAALRVNDAQWWQQFGSVELSGLLDKATKENNDLLAAAARVEQAQAVAKMAAAPLFPNVSGIANAQREFKTKPNAAVSAYQTGAQVAYEVDVFGRLRAAANSSDASAIASIYDRDALRLTINAQVAENYFNLLALYQRVKIAENNLRNAEAVLAIIQTRFDVGVVSQLELSQQKTYVANQKSALAGLQQQREVAQNSLAVLLGLTPENLTITADNLDNLSAPQVAPILPAELITHRPDIASLEAQMRVVNFDIGTARAAFFPSLTLNANTALAASPAFVPASMVSALASAITLPLFTGGQLQGGLEKATAHQKEFVAKYRLAVLTAFSEVENAFYGIKTTQESLDNLVLAVQEAQKAYDITMSRFNAGAIDFPTLLGVQNTFLQAQDAMVLARANRLSASVDLFKALGGAF